MANKKTYAYLKRMSHMFGGDIPLTKEEWQVITDTMKGDTAIEAGNHCGSSSRTVEKWLEKLYDEVGARNKAHFVWHCAQPGNLYLA